MLDFFLSDPKHRLALVLQATAQIHVTNFEIDEVIIGASLSNNISSATTKIALLNSKINQKNTSIFVKLRT